ncbi:membrane-associated phospholipid phosphatase [Photobacterium aphoticum]|uniref:Membrane-associated phospholipid phosphatase n=1 Tax=Photobacterium aphoticum TaxID=754436 RepID=A0A090RGB0_9GAMM|nr:membrane-associated phospholipid phosphatase [Photobacterium aphoticum]
MVGAVCIIRHNDSLVMISEVITQKLALPGGYIDETDTPESAAAREALEEAGISVRVVDLIQYRGRAAIYACQAVSPIFVSSFRDQRGFPIVASWYSKHFATEVDRVYLADTDKVPLSDHRYPDDVPLMEEWLAKTPNSEVLVYDRLDDTVNLLHKYELTLIQSLQQTVAQWPQTLQTLFEGAMAIMNLPGEIVFMLLVVVLTGAFTGPQRLLELLFVMLVGLFTTSLLKHGIASPRPFFALPELQKVDAHAFGFPSMHTLMATLLWGWLWAVITHSRSRSWKIGLAYCSRC